MQIKSKGSKNGITQELLTAGVVYKDCNGDYVLACDEDYVVVLETGNLLALSYSYNEKDSFTEVNAVLEVVSE